MNDFHLKTPSGKRRARSLSIPLAGRPGLFNAITDVEDVTVGYTTLIEGDDVRTGVTAILPRGRENRPVFAGCHSLNGNGELTGTIWVEEAGRCEGPMTITNTHSCGTTRDATIKWLIRENPGFARWALPVAGETYDGFLNDINGFHVRDEHVFAALDGATSGPIEEGSAGGGTGMICYGYKGGSGTASRIVDFAGKDYVVGAFVQANFGRRQQLTIAGVPIGRMLNPDLKEADERGSVIGVVATDAPLLPHQLKRLARRMGLGIGRSGAISGHGSGDIFLAFSTANLDAMTEAPNVVSADFIPNARIDPFFTAVIQATDEAVLNAMVANETMRGFQGNVVEALPIDRVEALMREHAVAFEP